MNESVIFRRNYLPIIMEKTHARRDNGDSGNRIPSNLPVKIIN